MVHRAACSTTTACRSFPTLFPLVDCYVYIYALEKRRYSFGMDEQINHPSRFIHSLFYRYMRWSLTRSSLSFDTQSHLTKRPFRKSAFSLAQHRRNMKRKHWAVAVFFLLLSRVDIRVALYAAEDPDQSILGRRTHRRLNVGLSDPVQRIQRLLEQSYGQRLYAYDAAKVACQCPLSFAMTILTSPFFAVADQMSSQNSRGRFISCPRTRLDLQKSGYDPAPLCILQEASQIRSHSIAWEGGRLAIRVLEPHKHFPEMASFWAHLPIDSRACLCLPCELSSCVSLISPVLSKTVPTRETITSPAEVLNKATSRELPLSHAGNSAHICRRSQKGVFSRNPCCRKHRCRERTPTRYPHSSRCWNLSPLRRFL